MFQFMGPVFTFVISKLSELFSSDLYFRSMFWALLGLGFGFKFKTSRLGYRANLGLRFITLGLGVKI